MSEILIDIPSSIGLETCAPGAFDVPRKVAPLWEVVHYFQGTMTEPSRIVTRAYRAWTKSEARARHKKWLFFNPSERLSAGIMFTRNDDEPRNDIINQEGGLQGWTL